MSWEKVKLSDVCQIIAGQSPPSSTYNRIGKGLPFFQGKADFGGDYPEVRMWCSEPNKISKPNDILLSVRAPVGPTNLCNVQSCIGRGLAAIRSNGKTEPRYVYYYFKSIEPVLSTKGNGSTFSAITIGDVKDLQIPLPPLPTQKRIANILYKADALRKKDQQLLQKYDDLAQSIFIDIFGDPVMNEKGWEVKRIANMIEFLTSGSRGWAKYYQDEGDIFLRINNIGKNKLNLNDIVYVNTPKGAEAIRTKVKPKDILLSITADLGRTAVIPEDFPDAYINQHLAIIRLEPKYNSFYVSQYISSDGGLNQLMKSNKGGVKAGLNFNDIKSLEIPLPPFDLQNKFSKISEKLNQQKELVNYQIKSSENIFHSLLQKAFTGELIHD